MCPCFTRSESDGESPWYRSPPAWTGAGTKVCPSVYIGSKGVIPAVSARSYAKRPFVRVGHAAGSVAMNRVDVVPASRSAMNGNESPAKLDPPPTQPITTSGVGSPAIAICSFVSSPITVWWSRTWFNTDPSEYLIAPFDVAATSTASLIAIPSEPVEPGSASRMALPACVVGHPGRRPRLDGLGVQDGLARLRGRRRRWDHLGAEGLHEDPAVR